jgi:ubiquinone/menaquinone biosynthesis C-methylase UbiE
MLTAEQIKAYYDQNASNRISYRKSRSYYWNFITRYCNYFIHEDDRVLEIGCGTGELLAELNGRRKVGVDFSEKMIEGARAQFPDLDFQVMDALQLDLNETFDVVIVSNLIGSIVDIQKAFEEIHKVCHDRTRIIVTYFNFLWEPLLHFSEFIGLKKKQPIQNWLSHKDIINLLYLAGFEVYRRNRNVLMPFKIPLVSWFLNDIVSKLPLFNALALNQFVFARELDGFRPRKEASVSIVIPARNESGNVENAIIRLPAFSSHQEIIYVEGNSTDDTWDKILEIQNRYSDTHDIKIFRQPGKGKYDAVKEGYKHAMGDVLMILDADLTVPPEDLPKFYDALVSGKGEFINGTRLVYPMEKKAMRFLNMLGNKFFSMAFSWLLEQPVKDTLCGTKVMYRTDYERLVKNRKFFGDFDPFGDFDLLFGAYKLNLKIVDLPVRYQERVYGDTNISRFKHGFVLLRMWGYAIRKIKFWS